VVNRDVAEMINMLNYAGNPQSRDAAPQTCSAII
jgi:hypothetical protein